MDRIVTIPNAISLSRLLAVPWFWWLILSERNFLIGGIAIVVLGATDWVDGFLARRLDQVTELGKFLDPLADRMMIASAVLAGLVTGVIPVVIGGLVVLREGLVALGAAILASRHGGTLAVRQRGKDATFLLYGAIPAFYLDAAGVAGRFFWGLGWGLGLAGLFLYYWVLVEYVGDIRRAAG